MQYPLFVYDFDNYTHKELAMIARILVLTCINYYRQAQKLRPGWEPFEDYVVHIFSDRSLINDHVTIDEKTGGVATDKACWVIVERPADGLLLKSRATNIGHELAHGLLWRYYKSGRIGVPLVHYFYNLQKIPFVELHDDVFNTKFGVADLGFLVENKDKFMTEIENDTAPKFGGHPYE